MTAALPFYDPYPRVEGVRNRLALQRPIDWDRVEQAVQHILDRLTEQVAKRRPKVRSEARATRSRPMPLFVHRVFKPVPKEADPIVVGVAFIRNDNGILVRGNMCGSDSGTIHFEHNECRLKVTATADAVLDAAQKVATRLAQEVDVLVEALDKAEPAWTD